MGYDVLKLLGFFHWEKTISNKIFGLFLISFFRLEISIDTHEASDSSNIFVFEGFQKFENAFGGGFGSDVEQDTDLGVELAAESLKEPEMGW